MIIEGLEVSHRRLHEMAPKMFRALLEHANDQAFSIKDAQRIILSILDSSVLLDEIQPWESIQDVIERCAPCIMKNKKVDKDFQDYLDDLCGSCHRTMEECYTLPGIAITNRDHIVVKCNKYACITMPEPEDFHMALNVKQKNLNEN